MYANDGILSQQTVMVKSKTLLIYFIQLFQSLFVKSNFYQKPNKGHVESCGIMWMKKCFCQLSFPRVSDAPGKWYACQVIAWLELIN